MLNHAERLVIKTKSPPRIVIIPDTHHPFCDYGKLAQVYKFIETFKPSHIIQIGDLYDFYTFSSFSRSVDLITPAQELTRGRKGAEVMWNTLTKLSPKSEKYQLLGNHERRIFKKLMTQAPEYESITNINLLFLFDGVRSFMSDRSELVINGTVFMHGFSGAAGYHMRYFRSPVVHGHTHRGGVVFEALHDKAPIFELDCGNLVDVDSVPFSYTETKTTKWLHGFGVIDENGPRFIPL
jgi:hypothetical protein